MSATWKFGTRVGGFEDSGASTTGMEPDAEAETDAAGSRCLDALMLAVNQASDTRQWYTETKELQLTSFKLCEACRCAHTVHLTVGDGIPLSLLAEVDAPHAKPEKRFAARIPRLRARRVRWALPSIDLISNPIDVLVDVEELYFMSDFKGSLEVRAWPGRLRKIEFNRWSHFNLPIIGVAWPPSLRQLTFGYGFNQPIVGVAWPASLRHLIFDYMFNQPIAGVTWPDSLEELAFAARFNQPIESTKWPRWLRHLAFGRDFNQPIEGVRWPASLQQLTLNGRFDQPIQSVRWPSSLLRLTLGGLYNQPIERVAWPTSLQQLWFGGAFNQPIDGVTSPTSLEEVTFGNDFNQPIGGVEWPSLRRLSIRGTFSQSLQTLGTSMSALQRMTLQLGDDDARYELLDDIEWPTGLTHLTVDKYVRLEVSIPPSVSVSFRYGPGW